jgi:hypothetical protein
MPRSATTSYPHSGTLGSSPFAQPSGSGGARVPGRWRKPETLERIHDPRVRILHRDDRPTGTPQDGAYALGWVSRGGSSPRNTMGSGKVKAMRLRSSAGCATSILAFALPFGAVGAQGMAGDGPVVCRIGLNIEDLYDFPLTRETFGSVMGRDRIVSQTLIASPLAASGSRRHELPLPVPRSDVESRRIDGRAR